MLPATDLASRNVAMTPDQRPAPDRYRPTLALGLLLALIGVAIAPACNSDIGTLLAAQAGCHQNSDCQAGLLCALGACRVMCATAADCGAGGQCVDDDDVAVCQYAAEA